MMTYIQILAIVLCSCFIQDAYSVQAKRVQKVKTGPGNDAVQLADAAGNQAAVMPPVRRTPTLGRTASRRQTAVAAPSPPPPPPPKYPHLTAMKDMFWNTLEDINQANMNGKLVIRAARNMMSNVLSNEIFWSSAAGVVRRRVKVTNDSKKADSKIRLCNALTAAVTSPNAIQSFQDVANEVYGTVSRIQPDVGTDALRLVTEMVNGGEVTRGLDVITSIVNKIKLSPRMLVRGFAMLHKTLNLGGTINMGGGLANGLMSLTSKFNNK